MCMLAVWSHSELCFAWLVVLHYNSLTLNFVSSCYFLLHYVNFCFVTLTQSARYISYAYSWFYFDMCELFMIISIFRCVTFHHVAFHFVTLLSVALPFVMLSVFSLHYLSLCYVTFHYVISIHALTFATLEFVPRVRICVLALQLATSR